MDAGDGGRRGEHGLGWRRSADAAGVEMRVSWYNRQDDSPVLRHLRSRGRKFGDRLSNHPEESIASQDVPVVSVDGSHVVLKVPLLQDVKSEWHADVTSLVRLNDVGIEHLAVEFPDVPFAGHHHERGFNAFHVNDVSQGWLRDIRIENADSGILTDDSAHLTIDGVRVLGHLGHYGIHVGGVYGALVKNFDIGAEEYHSVSFNTGSRGNVFVHGRARRAKLDQHRGGNHQNLFDDIQSQDDGVATKLFDHGGADYWGPTHGAFNTFWNVRIEFPGRSKKAPPFPRRHRRRGARSHRGAFRRTRRSASNTRARTSKAPAGPASRCRRSTSTSSGPHQK